MRVSDESVSECSLALSWWTRRKQEWCQRWRSCWHCANSCSWAPRHQHRASLPPSRRYANWCVCVCHRKQELYQPHWKYFGHQWAQITLSEVRMHMSWYKNDMSSIDWCSCLSWTLSALPHHLLSRQPIYLSVRHHQGVLVRKKSSPRDRGQSDNRWCARLWVVCVCMCHKEDCGYACVYVCIQANLSVHPCRWTPPYRPLEPWWPWWCSSSPTATGCSERWDPLAFCPPYFRAQSHAVCPRSTYIPLANVLFSSSSSLHVYLHSPSQRGAVWVLLRAGGRSRPLHPSGATPPPAPRSTSRTVMASVSSPWSSTWLTWLSWRASSPAVTPIVSADPMIYSCQAWFKNQDQIPSSFHLCYCWIGFYCIGVNQIKFTQSIWE